eukprot:6812620-Prymnesium_polylepis.1
MYSVGNGCYYTRERGALVKVASADERAAAPSSVPPSPMPPTPSSAAPPSGGGSHFSSGVDDAQSLSALVAQKLLDGFTLLSESCPATNVPLVQNAAGQIFSVGTNKWYMRVGGELCEAEPPDT